MAVHPTDNEIRRIYANARTIAFVGASPDPQKAANIVPAHLQKMGYRIVPVNPSHAEILGEPTYPTLSDVPFPVDVVDVLRPPSEAPGIAREAVANGAKVLWLQVGIHSDEAQAIAEEASLTFLSDICIRATHLRLGLGPVEQS